jgi:hypothetical protein
MTLSVGIVANPAASKDIRRVVTHAPSVSNHEKSNIVRRVLLGLAATPVERVWYLPDSAGITRHAADRLDLPFELLALDGDWQGSAADTTLAAAQLAGLGAGCLVTLGGDGTARAAALGSRTLPLLALSTGTNNAFPLHLEGTLAGMAAGSLACYAPAAVASAPILELWRNGELTDAALIDVAAVDDSLGGRAVWEVARLRAVVTTRLRPGTVGLSAIGGHLGQTPPERAAAVGVTIHSPALIEPLVPIAPGVVVAVPVERYVWLDDGAAFELPSGVALAVDGEREWMARPGESWQVRVLRAGVAVVDVEQALLAFAQAQPQPVQNL